MAEPAAAAQRASLAQLEPGQWVLPSLMILAAVGLLTAYVLPVMVVSKLVFFSDDYTLLSSIAGMWDEGYYVLAAIVFAFSVVFPPAKLGLLAYVWYRPLLADRRTQMLHWVGVLGKWSMLDVFVIALVIVATQSKALLGAEPREGLYVFAAAVLLSMVATLLVERSARRAGSPAI